MNFKFTNNDIKFFKKIVKEAGQTAHKYQKGKLKIGRKKDNTIVTEADIKIQNNLISSIKKKYPDFNFIYEENFDRSKDFLDSKKITVIIDPIDGTAMFSMYLPFWCISVAVFQGNKPLYGFVYSPSSDMFFYNDNKHSYLNENIVEVESNLKIDSETNMLAASEFQGKFNSSFPGKIRNFGSTALHSSLISDNKRNRIVLFIGKAYLWDWAASIAIVLKAGGNVKYLNGKELDFKEVVKNNYEFLDYVVTYSGVNLKQIQKFLNS